jgi:hypothetical protein
MMGHSALISDGNFHYRVIAMYLFDETPASAAGDQMLGPSQKLKNSLGGLEKQFAGSPKASSNPALQIQRLLMIYGKRGWNHYLTHQTGRYWYLHFKRDSDFVSEQECFDSEELVVLQNISLEQYP